MIYFLGNLKKIVVVLITHHFLECLGIASRIQSRCQFPTIIRRLAILFFNFFFEYLVDLGRDLFSVGDAEDVVAEDAQTLFEHSHG